MGKRSNFERIPRDFYPTPFAAVPLLISYLRGVHTFAEPCCGDGALVRHLESFGLRCVYKGDIATGQDALKLTAKKYKGADAGITNPPFKYTPEDPEHTTRLLRDLIQRFLDIGVPFWLLLPHDWSANESSATYLRSCSDIVPIGRVKWIRIPSTAAWIIPLGIASTFIVTRRARSFMRVGADNMTRSPPQHRPISPREPIDWGCTKDPGGQFLPGCASPCGPARLALKTTTRTSQVSLRSARADFQTLTVHGLWPRAMRAISELDNPHPRAQRRFHRSWGGNCWFVRALVGDDDVFYRALRKMFPPYRGGAKTLWRGQLDGMWIGTSWTSNFMCAEDYAFDGVNMHWREDEVKDVPVHCIRIPRHLMLRPLPNRRPLILEARMCSEIICRLPNRSGDEFKHEEYICDPRGVAYESFGAADLPDPRI